MAATRSQTWRRARADVPAGVVLGVESVPDSLASGLLAGVNPVAGLYACLVGMVGAATVASSSFLAVQTTGAMALIVSDADLATRSDPQRALFTLSVLTGVLMVISGLLRGGRLLRFVPGAVLTGFVAAVGVNIVLGQLGNATGYEPEGENRVLRAIDLLVHPLWLDYQAVAISILTMVLILALERTRIGSFGMVVAIVIGSLVTARLPSSSVSVVSDVADVPTGLPSPILPALWEMPGLLVSAVALAFVGLLQGAAVTTGVPTPDGRKPNTSRDFVAQGVGNVAAGLFQGMPVGGSLSASALVRQSGARSRGALFVAGLTMAVIILVGSKVVGQIAMPSLAALLIIVGARSVGIGAVVSVARLSMVQLSVLAVTFVLTLLVPVQYAVLAGVGLAVILFVARQSSRVQVRQVVVTEDGAWRESDPPATVAGGAVVLLQPYGSLFFASGPTLEAQLPTPHAASRGAVVIIRLRGLDQLGLSLVEVLRSYAADLRAHGATLKVVFPGGRRLRREVEDARLPDALGHEHVYYGSEWVGRTVERARADGLAMTRSASGAGADAPLG